jgi:hypothetical protein
MRIITQQDTIQIILQHLQLQTNALTKNHLLNTIIAEYLRYALNDLCLTKENTIAPVYQQRLINKVYDHLKPFFSEQKHPKNRFIKMINLQLQKIRDISRLSGGYVLPSPIRAIKMPRSDYILFIGGIETKTLSEMIGETVQIAGFVRYIHNKKINDTLLKQNNILWQNHESFLGDDPTDLNQWMQLKMKQARSRLEKISIDSSQVEIYYPKQNTHLLQNKRWINLQQLRKHNDELMLCRLRDKKRFIFFWGELSKQSPFRVIRESAMNYKERKKLHYGMDSYYKSPTQIKIRQQSDYCEITLINQLPPSYQRMLVALAQQSTKKEFYCPPIFKNDIVYFFEQLGITLS